MIPRSPLSKRWIREINIKYTIFSMNITKTINEMFVPSLVRIQIWNCAKDLESQVEKRLEKWLENAWKTTSTTPTKMQENWTQENM